MSDDPDRQIHTECGTYVKGPVETDSSDVVGRQGFLKVAEKLEGCFL